MAIPIEYNFIYPILEPLLGVGDMLLNIILGN